MTHGMAYHRRRFARCLVARTWTRADARFHEYGWLRSLDKSPARPLVALVAAESRIRA